ncbi:MAG TPA: xanthine dehydrogenase family protein molybdopterin-binding subunit [Thermoplasmata archaeon]|nr:xanthine dehydrogenase family protein molybdopterin-binding subunit [Thermoplasmata archaeon]
MIRSDAPAKVRGALEFGVDLEAPGALHAVLVGSPVAHGRIRRLDLSRARELPGVVAAIGYEQLPALLAGASGDPARPVLPAEELRYRGEPVAAVAARTLAEARRAAAAVRLEIDPLPAVPDIDSVFPEWPGSDAGASPHVNAHVHARWGDVERMLARSDKVLRETYRTSGIVQMALEPHACLADVRDGTWFVRSSTQTPFGVREDAAAILGLPEEKIVVEASWVGGGFGGKGASLLEPYALVLSAATGSPVKLQLSYAQEFELARSTLPAVIRIESALVAGRIAARRVRLLLDTGASLPGRDFATGYTIGFIAGPYRMEAAELEGYAVKTNKPPFGPHRAPFAPQCVFAAESHTDELAKLAGTDPLEFRLEHALREGDRTPLGQEVPPFALHEGLRRARQLRERWRKELPAGTGIGVAVGFWSTGSTAGGEARLTLSPTGLTIETAEPEIGSGSVVRGLVAVAEHELGLPASAIRVLRPDTAHSPYDSGVYGSRTLAALGRAIEEASRHLREELGRRLRGAGTMEFEFAEGSTWLRRGTKRVALAELLSPAEAKEGGIRALGKHYGKSGNIDESRVLAGGFFPYGDMVASVQLAAVEVDRQTGQVRPVRYAAFPDAGVVIDGPTYRAQIEGGVAMGLGEALTEETLWGPDGRLLNAGLLDYRVPTLFEVPPIEVEPIEGFPGAGPRGAKGGGEPPIIPVPAAIGNAVADATGARVRELPLTPERVARALKLL